MTNHWFSDMALLRIGPETEELSWQLNPPLHPAGHFAHGCLCPECAELRAAVGKGMYEYAESIAARQRGKLAAIPKPAGPRIRHPEGCRCQDCSDLRRYRTSDGGLGGVEPLPVTGAGDCTCRPPAWNPGSPYWAAHKPGCPMRARLCREGATRSVREKARTEPASLPDPAAEVADELRAFDTWRMTGPSYPDELAHPDRTPAGHCTECHLGLAVSGGRCFWCQLAITVKNENKGTGALAEYGPDHEPCPCRACHHLAFRHRLYVLLLIWAASATVLLTVAGVIHWRLP